jgi:glycosyltransferase involved in cell wall biosynthesis
VVTIEQNIGYGHGIHTGLQAAQGEVLAYSHADVQTPPEDIFRAFEQIERGEVDIRRFVIKGLRPGRDQERVLTRGLRQVTRVLTGVNIEDINGQPKVFHSDLLEAMDRPPVDFSYDTYVLYVAALNGLNVVPMEVEFGERLHGESKWASTILRKYRTIARYLVSLVAMSWRGRRRKDNPMGQVVSRKPDAPSDEPSQEHR